MCVWQPHLALQAELEQLDSRLVASAEPATENVELRFQRAVVLNALGRTVDARTAYIELLAATPGHFGALNNLGTLLFESGYTTLACTTYAEAIKHHPQSPTLHINLANVLLKNGDAEGARQGYEEALKLKPDSPEAHQGLACLYAELGDEENASRHRGLGYAARPIMNYPYRGAKAPVQVLVLASTTGGTVPIRHHLDDTIFSTSVIFVDFFDPTQPLPLHQVIFNAIGDADLCQASLAAAAEILKRTSAPVINSPKAVLATGRAANAARLAGLSGVVAPKIALLPRHVLTAAEVSSLLTEHGFDFPLVLRSPGFHTGKYFVRISSPDELTAALPSLPGEELMVIQYLDARGSDGKFRKYRVMMIDGQFFPLHAAISNDWKVHYFSADMTENAAHRAEDEAFLNDMDAILGQRALDGLRRICKVLNLEYAGVDFGLNASGEVLLFEANATMVVHPPDADARWDYRRAPVQRILNVVREMFLRRVVPGAIGGALT
jgi:tetratricopeptide (TPR) repeat protein